MRRGRIVQIGTGADLVLRPVDDYVADFTRDVPRDKVRHRRQHRRAGPRPARWRASRCRRRRRSTSSCSSWPSAARRSRSPVARAGSSAGSRPKAWSRRWRRAGATRIMSIGVASQDSAAARPLTIDREACALACRGGGRHRASGAQGSGAAGALAAGCRCCRSPSGSLPPWRGSPQHFRDFFRAITWLLGWPFGWIRSALLWHPLAGDRADLRRPGLSRRAAGGWRRSAPGRSSTSSSPATGRRPP